MKIGVFDSGIGGLSVAKAIQQALPESKVIFKNDAANVPYGLRPPKQLLSFVQPILAALINEGCQVIVIACNSVTTTIIDQLRATSSVPLIGMEPMVKPAAALTKTGIIAVCATPTTLKSTRYAWLKQHFAGGVKVLEPDCSDWSYMIENKQIDHQKIQARIESACSKGADIIVLGCTHYHWIEEEVIGVAKRYGVQVIQPEQAVIARLKQVLGQLT